MQSRTMIDLVGFEKYLLRESISIVTIKTYKNCVSRLDSFTKESVFSYLDLMAQRVQQGTLGAGGYNKYVKAYRSYAKYFKISWGDEIKRMTEKPRLYVLLSDSEIENLIAVRPPPNKWGMFFMFLAYTGARPKEIVTLKQEHIENDSIKLWETKTVAREIAMPKVLQEAYEVYKLTLEGELLFESKRKKGSVLSNHAMNYEFRRRLKVLGIDKKTRVYDLRHSFATQNVRVSPLPWVQKQLGHKNISTTQRYIHATLEDLRELVKNDPRLNKDSRVIVDNLTQNINSLMSNSDFDPVFLQEAVTCLYKAISGVQKS